MRTLKNILKIGALAGVMAFMSSCQKDNISYETPHFTSISEKKIAGNLERPSGLSSNYIYGSEKSGTKSIQDDNLNMLNLSVFVQCPLFYFDGHEILLEKTKNPILSNMSGSLNNLTINSSQELNIESLFDDFNSLGYLILEDSLARPMGLTLDDIILKDGSVLLSSNSSDKIFRINQSNLEVYLQDKRLERITDMLLGTDGKVYAVQVPSINYDDSSIIESPKRVISIDNEKINVEFELPSDVNTHRYRFTEEDIYSSGWWRNAPYLEKLKIVENSELGKKNFGAEFYISDLLEDVIYKVDAQKNVSVLAKGLRYPSSLAVDLSGNIFYTTSPIWLPRGSTDIEYPTELCELNPKTGQLISDLVFPHKFDERDIEEYASAGGGIFVNYNKETYVMPVGFNVTNILYESEKKLDFLFTNSHQGTLKWVSVDK